MAILSKNTTIGGRVPLTVDLKSIDTENACGLVTATVFGDIDANMLLSPGIYNFNDVTNIHNFPDGITMDYLNDEGICLVVLTVNEQKCVQMIFNETYNIVRNKIDDNTWTTWENISGGATETSNTSIIDVLELPTTDINEYAIYRLVKGQFVYNNQTALELQDAAICQCVFELPEVGTPVSSTPVLPDIYVYYNLSDKKVYCYIDELLTSSFGKEAGWYEIDEIISQLPIDDYAGVVYSLKYEYHNDNKSRIWISADLYTVINETWVPLNIVGKSGTGYNSEIFNDVNLNLAIGAYSHAEGQQTRAGGMTSHAEGYNTKANATYSHAEGSYTTVSGGADYSHAEGLDNVVSGAASHAEGAHNIVGGNYSHVEGFHTIANGDYQHVEGQYNEEDEDDKYAHIVGNGSSDEKRSNAHTLDWNGNAWFAGKITVGDNNKRVLTEDDLSNTTITENIEVSSIILKSADDSGKRYRLSINGDGYLIATEIVE